MNPSDLSSTASRLCAQCGLCCNGVMFHSVELQPADSAKDLATLGLKLKRKRGRNFLLQPCPAFQKLQCSIYAARPERCRLFECQQLKRLAAGRITESMAQEKIHAAQRRVGEVNKLLLQAGKTNLKRPLTKRFEKAMAELLATSSAQEAAEHQRRLIQAMRELNTLLDDDFRIVPSGLAAASNEERGVPKP